MNRQIITAILIIFSIQTLAAGNTFYVPSRDYPTIQDAINAAFSGDVVVVYPGVYSGLGNRDLDLNGRAITVRSQIDPDNPNWDIIAATIIDCGGNKYFPHRAFHFHNGEGLDSKVLGFTIRNGYQRGMIAAPGISGENPPVPYESIEDDPNGVPRAERGSDSTVSHGFGGAIFCENASSPTIQYCIISDCSVSGGHGGDGAPGLWGPWNYQPPDPLDPNLPDPNAEPIEVLDGQWGGYGGSGSGNGYGGAIACIGASSPLISDCIIKNNSAHGGRGGDGGAGGYAAEAPNYNQGNASNGGDAGTSYGDGIGGGIYCEGSSAATVVNCTFINNVATTGIRGVGGTAGEGNPLPAAEGGPATDGAIGAVFSSGGIAGGAAYFLDSDASFTNCTFTENKAFQAYPYYDTFFGESPPAYTIGGALYCDINNLSVVFVNIDTCQFTSNLGGAVYCGQHYNLDIKDCTFIENSDPNDWMDLWSSQPNDFGSGGAIYAGIEGNVLIQNSDFRFNSAKNDGGALKSESDISLDKCLFNRNTAGSYGGASDVYRSGVPLIIGVNSCSFIRNQSVYGGGLSTENFTADFENCYFIGNEAERGGALDLAIGSVNIIGGFIKENKATDGYGGGVNCYAAEADIRHCTIMDNFADGVYPTGGGGGGIYFYGWTHLHRLFNCLVVGNSATFDGGAINSYYAEPEIGNCTFVDNFAGGYGGAVFSSWGSDVQIIDSIFRSNYNHAIHEEFPGGEATVTYSLFYNNPDGDYYDSGTGITYSGAGQIDLIPGGSDNLYDDPLFVTGDLGDYYLRQLPVQSLPQSAAVDIGSDTAANIGLGGFTTRTDNIGDSGQVDIGYHYYDSSVVGFYQLTASVIGGHGTIEPTSGTYYAGAIVTLTAEPDIGWRVKAWSGTDDDSSVKTINSVVMNSDRVVTVEFGQPRTLIVSLGGGQQGYYNNIQDAIQNARDGDTVIVYPGIYYGGNYGEMAYIDKSITVRSVHPDDPCCVASTIIDGYAGPPWSDYNIFGVIFGPSADAESVLNGFTIRNCGGSVGDSDPGNRGLGHPDGYDGGSIEGPAVLVYPGAGPVVKNCVITDNLIIAGNGGNGENATQTANAGRGGWPGWAHGGAVYCGPNSTPTFINCQIINNFATGGNGGNGGNETTQAYANYGGGWSILGTPEYPAIYYDPFSTTAYSITDSYLWEIWEWDEALVYYSEVFGADANRTSYFGNYRWYTGMGGGAYCDIGSEVSFVDCVISGNFAQGGMSGQGGLQLSGRPLDPLVPYEIPSFGGGVYCAARSTVHFSSCTIANNLSSDPNLVNHRIDLYMGHGGGVCAEDTATVIFDECIFSDNTAAAGGALHFSDSNLMMSNCDILTNTGYHGGGLFGEHGQATIYRCNFTDNEAVEDLNEPNDTQGQGGGLYLWAADVNIIDCEFVSNQSEASGGGVFAGGGGEPSLTNCLITNNTAGRDGAGVSVNIFAQLTISNCTIVDNELTGEGFDNTYGGGVYSSYESYTNIINSILWGNSAGFGPQLAIGTGFLYDPSPSTVDVSYSDVEGGESEVFIDEDCVLNWGAGNISSDPLFVTGDLGDYYLSQIASGQTTTSPCVDTGSTFAKFLGLHVYTTSTDNSPDRNLVDMGYHYLTYVTITGDFDRDGDVDLEDLRILLSYWLEQNCWLFNDCEGADFEPDGDVDWIDYARFAEIFYLENIVDITAPKPNPMTWETEPSALDYHSVIMTATTATDVSGVQYYFDCVSGDCHDSGLQDSPTYTDTGLADDAAYTYRVRATDKSQLKNSTAWSSEKTVIIPSSSIDIFPPAPNPSTWQVEPFENPNFFINMTATTATDASPPVMYYFDCTSGPGNDSGWQLSSTYQDHVGTDEDFYCYTVKTKDAYNFETMESPQRGVWVDHTAPLPNPLTWEKEPNAVSEVAINMVATTAADPCGVQYYFECTDGNCHDSGWQDSPNYTDTGLYEDTTYTYRVRTRDKSHNYNVGGWSDVNSATTWDDVNSPQPDPAEWAEGGEPNAVPGLNEIAMTAETATDNSGVEYYFECTDGNCHDSGWQDSPTYTDTGLDVNEIHTYRVKTQDKASPSNETGWSTEKSALIDFIVPTPDPAVWLVEPYEDYNDTKGCYQHRMEAAKATDINGFDPSTGIFDPNRVEYYFECHNDVNLSSNWQNSPVYDVNVPSAGLLFMYRVKARDKSTNHNETGFSDWSPALP